ncbi:thiosulfate/3-mercaptopyruvate sulfurtransferase [Deinobacterium chartae]|uniref:Sulfurtransferase n=1 Tax=Deinobacterium chartae TaxID=521158 RepID=A0A841I6W9_9DEIO|nr:sulfurtransferase [Deinobacterium chartae]MBB6099979.1 thiosulfate/3-mercaptopyruvate sulfurtransferase [Deinobacterium chartae]
MTQHASTAYAKDVLVTTAWLAEHLNDPKLRLIEVDEDILLYDTGHIPGAVKIDWHADFWHPVMREFIQPQQFAQLLGRLGITEDTQVILYGDKSNWWAAYAYWFFSYNGYTEAKLLDGGRQKWVAEQRELTTAVPDIQPTVYPVRERNESIRAYRSQVEAHLAQVANGSGALVDIRSPDEFSGKVTHMANYPQEGVLRGGHIPGARNVPWAKAVNEDGTFRSAEELRALYAAEGITAERDIITYCRIAERSSHTWFALTQLLGYPSVANYDGSWTEWGNAVGVPIEKTHLGD